MELRSAENLCTQCGRAGHFVKDCYAKTDTKGNKIQYEDGSSEDEIVWGCNYCNREFETEYGCMLHERSCSQKKKTFTQVKNKSGCFRCGREGHYAPDCYASRHIKGYDLYY